MQFCAFCGQPMDYTIVDFEPEYYCQCNDFLRYDKLCRDESKAKKEYNSIQIKKKRLKYNSKNGLEYKRLLREKHLLENQILELENRYNYSQSELNELAEMELNEW